MDTETTGLDAHTDRLCLLQLATPEHTYLIDAAHLDLTPLRDWFADAGTRKVIQNAAFDLKFLLAEGIEIANVWDTMLASQVLSAGEKGVKHSLAALSERYLKLPLAKDEQTSDWSGELSPEQLEYAAKDAQILLKLYDVLDEKIKAAGLERTLAIENSAVVAIAWMGYHGTPFDAERWVALVEKAKADQAAALAELERLREGVVPDDQFLPMKVTWKSNPQVRAFLRASGIDVADTSEETLTPHKDHPVVKNLLAHRDATKRLSSYGGGWLEHLHPKTGRLHPDWRQLEAVTGRMSCSKPGLQTMPRDPAYRACIAAPAGRVLLKADFSQVELRIGAEIADDETLIRAYRHGQDVHTLTAQKITGKADVTKAERQLAKAVNFGLLFGAGAETLQRYAATSYGITINLEEARRFKSTFLATYKDVAAWHRLAGQKHKMTTETRTLARRRRLFVAGECDYTQWLNSPVQGSGVDALKTALGLLWQRRGECPDAFPVLAVHDEIVVEAPVEQADAAKTWLLAAMHDALTSILTRVPAGDLDVLVGRDWSMRVPIATTVHVAEDNVTREVLDV